MEIYFSESTSLYIYSSFLQANAAIIAILGLFIIYRIQALQSSIDLIKADVMRDRGLQSHPKNVLDFELASMEEKEKILNKLAKNDDYYYLHYKIWVDNFKSISKLKTLVTKPTVLLTSAIVVDGVSLSFCSHLHIYHKSTEIYLAYIIILIHIFIWIYICKSVIKVIKQD